MNTHTPLITSSPALLVSFLTSWDAGVKYHIFQAFLPEVALARTHTMYISPFHIPHPPSSLLLTFFFLFYKQVPPPPIPPSLWCACHICTGLLACYQVKNEVTIRLWMKVGDWVECQFCFAAEEKMKVSDAPERTVELATLRLVAGMLGDCEDCISRSKEWERRGEGGAVCICLI